MATQRSARVSMSKDKSQTLVKMNRLLSYQVRSSVPQAKGKDRRTMKVMRATMAWCTPATVETPDIGLKQPCEASSRKGSIMSVYVNNTRKFAVVTVKVSAVEVPEKALAIGAPESPKNTMGRVRDQQIDLFAGGGQIQGRWGVY